MNDPPDTPQLSACGSGTLDESSNVAPTPMDDGSDFYNTPLAAEIPVHNNVSVLQAADISEPTTPSKPAVVIPGLTLCKESSNLNGESTLGIHKPVMNLVSHGNDVLSTEVQESDLVSGNGLKSPNIGVPEAEKEGLQVDGNTPENPLADDEENREWEVDSSPIQSSSESSTDSSDESDEEDDDYPILSPEEQVRILMQAEGGSDDEREGKGRSGGTCMRTTNEQPEEIPPVPDISVSPDMKIVLLGQVETIVENIVLVKASISGEYQVLESNSVLCLEDRAVIGVVSEILGRVEQPLYAIRFQDPAKINEFGLSPGKSVFYVEKHAIFVFTQPLRSVKGSDASNFHDEEIGDEEAEFSDDEAEAEYKRKLKLKHREKKDTKSEYIGFERPRKGPPGPSNLGKSELNYDDPEDGYTPLARPKNLHEMMGSQEAPIENTGFPSRSFRDGGRGRGRGRGGQSRHGSWDSRHRHRSQDGCQQNFQDQGVNISSTDQESQQLGYAQPTYEGNQQSFQSAAQQNPTYTAYHQQPQPQPQQSQQAFSQVPGMAQLPFPLPFPLPYQQNPYSNPPLGTYINPAFFAALQQQPQPQPQQQMLQQSAPLTNNPPTAFDDFNAQMDILRRLNGGAANGSG